MGIRGIRSRVPGRPELSLPARLFSTLLVDEEGGVRTITLNRPERRNAMTPEMQTELIAALKDASSDASSGSCRVVVFRGVGEAFCSGLDLSVLRSMHAKSGDTEAEGRADAVRIALLFRALFELPKPTIAAVHGAAIAGGTGLATLCDFTLAVPTAKFGYTEVRIGFVPALVSAFLALQIGDKRSRDLLMTGRLFDAHEAHRLGLVNEIVEPDALDERVRSLAQTLIANSPRSLAATKRLMTAQNKPWLDAAIAAAMEANAEARTTDDFREGISAFLEKRKAVWKT
jgi:methylglutaconyl-CoA hydratase